MGLDLIVALLEVLAPVKQGFIPKILSKIKHKLAAADTCLLSESGIDCIRVNICCLVNQCSPQPRDATKNVLCIHIYLICKIQGS